MGFKMVVWNSMFMMFCEVSEFCTKYHEYPRLLRFRFQQTFANFSYAQLKTRVQKNSYPWTGINTSVTKVLLLPLVPKGGSMEPP